MKDIFAELAWRGLLNQSTDDGHLAEWFLEKPRTIYVGFDPTADSLHVGHLLAVMLLRRFQQAECLRYLTDLTQVEIVELEAAHVAAPERRDAQKRLGSELTRMVHGEEGLASALRATAVLFGAEITDLTDAELDEAFADAPNRELPFDRLGGPGLPLAEALVEAGLAKSKAEARRTITQGGVYMNNRRAEDPEIRLGPSALAGETVLVLRTGKKAYSLLKFRS